MTPNLSIQVRDIFYLSDDSTTFIVPKDWADGVAEIRCEILLNGASLGVKELFVNFLVGPNRRRDISAYSVMEELDICDEHECVLVLREL